MKNCALLIVISLFVLSCQKEEKGDLFPASNSIVTGQNSVGAFTATINGYFKNVDVIDIALGKSGVLHCVMSEDAGSKFIAWKNGSDNPGCFVFDEAFVSGESMKCTITGLFPDTEYSYCLFLQKRDGSRELGTVSTFRTLSFNPEMKTLDIKDVQCFSASAEGEYVMNENDASFCETGIIVSDQSGCTIDNSTAFGNKGSDKKKVIADMVGLESNKKYYCRSYVKYPVTSGQFDYAYGPENTFMTKNLQDVAVDLGLPSGLLWASYNIGANKPEDFGEYYSWAESESKESYHYTAYKYCSDWDKPTKYNTNDNKTTLESVDDVAHVKWGNNWRIPTKEDFEELIDNCTWTWSIKNGIAGYEVVGNKPGYTDRSIFFPAGGFLRFNRENNSIGWGWYWASSLLTDLSVFDCPEPIGGWMLKLTPDYYIMSWTHRYDGLTVRPVYSVAP